MKEDRRFYVYEHIRLDNMTCFYVGKGCEKRAFVYKRNIFHDRIAEKHGYIVSIVADNLTEKEAYEMEAYLIDDYVFNLGYGIAIKDYFDRSECYLTNLIWGGTGGNAGIALSKETIRKIKQHHISKQNNEKSKRWFKQAFINNTGKNNNQYRVSPKDRMDKETYDIWRKKQHMRKFGETNPNYGNDTLKKKYAKNPQLSKEKQSRPANQNGRAIPILLYDKDMNFIEEFSYIGECCEYLITNYNFKSKSRSIRGGIRKAINENRLYKKMFYIQEKSKEIAC